MLFGVPEIRDAGNRIALADASVARNHSLLRREGTVWRVLDLESRNETLVNGVAVKDRLLESGDRVEVGTSLFVYHGPEEATRTAGEIGATLMEARRFDEAQAQLSHANEASTGAWRARYAADLG